MEKILKHGKVALLVSTLIMAVLFGYCLGFAKGCRVVMDDCQEWKEMYDEHINRQWDMIQERDSIYMHYLQIRLHCEKYENADSVPTQTSANM